MPFGQFFENRFNVFGKPSGSQTCFCRVFSRTRRVARALDDAFSFFERLPCVFIIRDLDDIFGCRRNVFWRFSKDIAPLFGGFENYMSSISKQPRRMILTRISRSGLCIGRNDGLEICMERKGIIIEQIPSTSDETNAKEYDMERT